MGIKPLKLRFEREPLATMSTLAAEGQRQYKTRWYGLGGEESSSTAIIQALSPAG